jgi:2-polyprenyl-3-methyl-5-hydroxy-6-metoxy-1,4-benzoquinol methylase
MIDLSKRSEQEEIMDDFSQSGTVIDQTLLELNKINTLLGGNHVSAEGLQALLKQTRKTPISVVDLGCGGGDMMMYLFDWARQHKYALQFSGIDANPAIIDYARKHTAGYANIDYQHCNIFDASFQHQTFDIIHCSLFAHHFTDDLLSQLLRQLLRQCRVGIVINDLHRHPVSYYFTKWIIRALSRSEMVRYDSVVSVARSFTRNDWKKILDKAGIHSYALRWKWAFRWQLVISKKDNL